MAPESERAKERWPVCPKCSETDAVPWLDGHCIDCWPGYNLCGDEKCDHYRCEHADDCGNYGCECKGFVEGGTNRIITNKEFEALKKSWGM